MKQNHPANMLLAIFSVVLIGLCILCAAGKGMIFYKQSATQKSILRGVESISEATMAVTDDFSNIIEKASYEKYRDYKKLADSTTKNPMKEDELRNHFREAVTNRFISETGGEDGLGGYIESLLPEIRGGKLSLDMNNPPYLSVNRDENGYITSASVKNVVFQYDGIPGTKRSETVKFDIIFPETVFYGGSDELFDYCMMAEKGIYATGATSSFVGDIFAGTHQAQESRDMEIAYGEIGSYGGLNFLSTQVGIEASKIISLGDINLSGSFVIFNGHEKGQLKLYGDKIRKMRGYMADSMYSVDGEFFESDLMPENVMSRYLGSVEMAKTSLSKVTDIPFYYDSNNDEEYKSDYRKIVSSEDVEIEEDITGLIMTPSNVIIKAGCNVEGLIMCGDRIYIQGNNSIVSNPSVVKTILTDEINDDSENDALAELDSMGSHLEEANDSMKFYAKDYIGGFVSPGIKRQVYFVVPYQE